MAQQPFPKKPAIKLLTKERASAEYEDILAFINSIQAELNNLTPPNL